MEMFAHGCEDSIRGVSAEIIGETFCSVFENLNGEQSGSPFKNLEVEFDEQFEATLFCDSFEDILAQISEQLIVLDELLIFGGDEVHQDQIDCLGFVWRLLHLGFKVAHVPLYACLERP